MEKTAFAYPVSTGLENLPKDSGYVMYPNHQGKYDVLGIVSQHEEMCSFVFRTGLHWKVLLPEVCELCNAKTMDRNSVKDAMRVMKEVVEDVKAGRKYIIFPEGGYKNDQKNQTAEFKPGCFKFATKAHAPIVPVALIDSYKVLNNKIFEFVTPQIHYLEPIYYEDYKDMTTVQIADLVKSRIDACIAENAPNEKVSDISL